MQAEEAFNLLEGNLGLKELELRCEISGSSPVKESDNDDSPTLLPPDYLQARDRIINNGFMSRDPRVKAIIMQEKADREFLRSLQSQVAKDKL